MTARVTVAESGRQHQVGEQAECDFGNSSIDMLSGKIIASFFVAIAILVSGFGLSMLFGFREGRAAGTIPLAGAALVCAYLFWPVRRKKTAFDFVLGALACIVGLMLIMGSLGASSSIWIVVLGVGFGLATVMVGVGLFCKKGSETGTKPSEPPLLS